MVSSSNPMVSFYLTLNFHHATIQFGVVTERRGFVFIQNYIKTVAKYNPIIRKVCF